MPPGPEKGTYGFYKTPQDPFIGRKNQKAIRLGPCSAGDGVLRGTFLSVQSIPFIGADILRLREPIDYHKIVLASETQLVSGGHCTSPCSTA